jgi:hypothetical protein
MASLTPHEACQHAAELLKAAGFEFRYASMKSEACYYGLPGVPDLIRIAAHKHDRGIAGMGKIIARITYSDRSAKPIVSEAHVHNTVATAIMELTAHTVRDTDPTRQAGARKAGA